MYGTLLENLGNELSRFLHSGSKIIGKGYFIGELYKISWFPGAILSEKESNKVYGTLIELNDVEGVFKVLDPYEGFKEDEPDSSLFIRQQTKVFLENNKVLNAWVYLYNQKIDQATRIVSGDFLKDAAS